jgi:hypothetical protein
MMREVRNCSLHRHPNRLHRTTAQVWNEMTRRWACQLKMLSVPSFAKPSKRIAWSALGNEFRQEIDNYLRWCGGEDVFAADARAQPMAPRTVELCRNQLRAAVTALVESGVDVGQLTSLAELVSPRNFKAILTHRYESKNGLANTFNIYLARALIRIAREWVKLGATELAEFNRLAGRLPNLTTGLTAKNRAALRQFDDGAKLRQLYALPHYGWKSSAIGAATTTRSPPPRQRLPSGSCRTRRSDCKIWPHSASACTCLFAKAPAPSRPLKFLPMKSRTAAN